MKLSVLGSSAVRPNAGDACAGYVIESGGHRYLVDCGPGVASRFLTRFDLANLDGVLISHGHPDHCSDLVFLRQALRFAPDSNRTHDHVLPVFANEPTLATIRALGAVFSSGEAFWEPLMGLRAVDQTQVLELPSLSVRFHYTEHSVPCLAMRFDVDGKSIVYGADGGPSAELAQFAHGADVLILEATLPQRSGFEQQSGHMSAAEAGELAERAGVGRLLLTHFFDHYDRDGLLAAAEAECSAPVEIACFDRSWVV